jgi:hypothetical protein
MGVDYELSGVACDQEMKNAFFAILATVVKKRIRKPVGSSFFEEVELILCFR